MDSSSSCQNRKSRRSKVLLAATLEEVGAPHSVKLRNLSADGALVESKDLPAKGAAVVFRRNELIAPGRIIWVNGQFAGIAFDEKLAPEQVLRHIPEARPKIQAKHWRPGLGRDMTPEERTLVETWGWSPTARPGAA